VLRGAWYGDTIAKSGLIGTTFQRRPHVSWNRRHALKGELTMVPIVPRHAPSWSPGGPGLGAFWLAYGKYRVK